MNSCTLITVHRGAMAAWSAASVVDLHREVIWLRPDEDIPSTLVHDAHAMCATYVDKSRRVFMAVRGNIEALPGDAPPGPAALLKRPGRGASEGKVVGLRPDNADIWERADDSLLDAMAALTAPLDRRGPMLGRGHVVRF
ncbi:MAG: hypothetical protein AAGJ94_11805 [Pseudomonadota bacterium]